MKDFIAKILIKIIGERHMKKMLLGDRLEVDLSTILTDEKWHHIGVSVTAWVKRSGKKQMKFDDVAIFKDGKRKKDIIAIYKLS